MRKIVVLLICLFFMVGCSSQETDNFYKSITSSEAYEIINNNDSVVILDVRSESEYKSGHIKDAINIPVDSISDVQDVVNDKDKVILVYCRSGNRSKVASEELVKLGYTNVNDFGGINNWEYGTITE